MADDRLLPHTALGVDSSPRHIVVLTKRGTVLVFANETPVRYMDSFETGLSGAAAIALALLPRAPGAAADGEIGCVCVLPRERKTPGIHVWVVHDAGGVDPKAERIGVFPDPDPKVSPPAVRLDHPVAMATGFPDRPGMLYVLDRGRNHVRAIDVADVVSRVRKQFVVVIAAEPVVDKLPLADGAVDIAVGPGQEIHLVCEGSSTIYTYARR